MNSALAAALVAAMRSVSFAAAPGDGAHDHQAAVQAQTLQPPQTPPPAGADKPAITQREFEIRFGTEPDAPKYQKYLDMPKTDRKQFENEFKANASKGPDDAAAAKWAIDWRSKFNGVSSVTNQVTTKDPATVFDGGTSKGTVSAQVPRNGPDTNKNPPRGGNPDPVDEKKGLKTAEPPGTVPDVAATKPAGPVVNDAFRSLLRNAALGGLAGAVVGIGLLPLFGPIGIFIGAAMGASLMIMTKKLSG